MPPRRRSSRSPRFAMRMRCQVVRERDFKLVATSVMNVSESGLLVDADVPVSSGDRMIVTFYSPAVRSWIDATGRVARVAHGPKWMGRKQAFGLVFDDVDASSRNDIQRSMAALATLRRAQVARPLGAVTLLRSLVPPLRISVRLRAVATTLRLPSIAARIKPTRQSRQ